MYHLMRNNIWRVAAVLISLAFGSGCTNSAAEGESVAADTPDPAVLAESYYDSYFGVAAMGEAPSAELDARRELSFDNCMTEQGINMNEPIDESDASDPAEDRRIAADCMAEATKEARSVEVVVDPYLPEFFESVTSFIEDNPDADLEDPAIAEKAVSEFETEFKSAIVAEIEEALSQ